MEGEVGDDTLMEGTSTGITNVEDIVDDYDYGDLEDELEALREEDERERGRVVDLPVDVNDASVSSPVTAPAAGVYSRSVEEDMDVGNFTEEFYAMDEAEQHQSPPPMPVETGAVRARRSSRQRQQQHAPPSVAAGAADSVYQQQQQAPQLRSRVRVERHGHAQAPPTSLTEAPMDMRPRRRVVHEQQQAALQQEQRRQRKLKSVNQGVVNKEIRRHRRGTGVRDHMSNSDDDERDGDASSELSSGLGYTTERPRDSTRRPGDALEFQRALSHGADEYASGNFADLPVRIAYEQLHSLEAMNRKVQLVIEHNAEIFGRKVKSLDLRLMRRAFDDWRLAKIGGAEKKLLIMRLLKRYQRKSLWKAFNAWRLKHGRTHDPEYAMLKKAQRVVTMGLMRRTFTSWFNVFQESVREAVLMLREQRARDEAEARHNMRQLARAERCYRRKKLYAVWVRLDKNVDRRIEKRAKMRRVIMYYQKRTYAKAFTAWFERFAFKREQRRKVKNAVMKIKKSSLARAMLGWEARVQYIAATRRKVSNALARLKNRMASKALCSWESHLDLVRRQRQFALKMLMPYRYNGFHGWLEWLELRKRNRLIVKRSLARLKHRNLIKAWGCWLEYVSRIAGDKQLNTMSGLRERLETVVRENGQLRKDNERFVKLIDSGEWGRTRVKELSQAGEVLRGERDALQKLITNLRVEHDNVRLQSAKNESELRKTKDRILSGNFVQRNKLVVKGGSSFNGLVRAMKADMLDPNTQDEKKMRQQAGENVTAATTTTAGRDPASMLYAVDKLSMQKVSVFPDGELNVQAINPEGTEPFKRSSMKAKSARPREAVRERFVQTRSSRVFDSGSLVGLTHQEQEKMRALLKEEERVTGLSSSAPKPR